MTENERLIEAVKKWGQTVGSADLIDAAVLLESLEARLRRSEERVKELGARNVTPASRARRRRWAKANPNPAKEAAYYAVKAAIKKGEIAVATVCSKCGKSPKRQDGVRAVQAHHHKGYDHPLDIVWLCVRCHMQEHAAIGKAHET